VAYHIRKLVATGLLEAAGTSQRRGAVEHSYRASAGALELLGMLELS
jgi:hypothetical protein